MLLESLRADVLIVLEGADSPTYRMAQALAFPIVRLAFSPAEPAGTFTLTSHALRPAAAPDRCLCVAPLFTATGITRSRCPALAVGGSVVCTSGFDSGSFFDWLAELELTSTLPDLPSSAWRLTRWTTVADGSVIQRPFIESDVEQRQMFEGRRRTMKSGATRGFKCSRPRIVN